jgi:hypothetical protein
VQRLQINGEFRFRASKGETGVRERERERERGEYFDISICN